MQFALFSVLANGVSQLGQRGDLLVLDHFSSNREFIGYYSLALIFLMVANQVTGTVQSIVTPYFSEHALNETWLRRQLTLNQGRMTLLSIIVAIGTYILALFVVPLFFGSSYHPTLTYLSVLLLSYVAWSSYSVIGPTLLGMGLMHYNFIIVAISTPVGLVLSYLLLNKFGIIGVAWSQVSTNIITLVLVLIGISMAFKRTFGSSRQS